MHRRAWLRTARKLSRLRPGLPRFPHPLDHQLAPVAQWFHALADTTRLGILEFLSQRDRSAGELQGLFDVPPSRMSFHLKVLTESELVRVQRLGRYRFYSLRRDTLDAMVTLIRKVMPGAHVGTCPLTCCR